MEKLKFKAFKGLFGMFVFFGILKKMQLFVHARTRRFFLKKICNLVTTMVKQANIFRFFSSNHGNPDTS